MRIIMKGVIWHLAGGVGRFWRSLKNFVRKVYWAIRYETTDRYHFLDLRGPGYRRGYLDYDQVLLRAGFRTLELMAGENWGLKDVTEADLPEDPDDICYASIFYQIQIYKQLKGLLHWWRVERAEQYAAIEKLPWPERLEAEKHLYQFDTDRLFQLVALRPHLWA